VIEPVDLAARIREWGAVLDVRATHELYAPLLAQQERAGVDVVRDIAYGSDARQRLDVYRPAQGPANAPVLLVFHGGGFIRGDKADRENAGLRFARAGLVTLVANYRLAPSHPWPAGAEDVVSALNWAAAHVAGHGGDRRRIWLLGESAGATHVATAALLRRFHPAGAPPGRLPIAGAVLVSGVYNVQLELLARRQFGVPSPDPRNEAYFGSDFALYPSRSVVDLIDASPFPLLMTYAELDLLPMQVQAGELFARLITRHGFNPDLKVIRGHNHLTQVFAVNTGDERLTAPVLDFIQRHDST
jgi:triacylglycerol lipase